MSARCVRCGGTAEIRSDGEGWVCWDCYELVHNEREALWAEEMRLISADEELWALYNEMMALRDEEAAS